MTTTTLHFDSIELGNIQLTYRCDHCDTTATVDPTFFEQAGNPVCVCCDEDMEIFQAAVTTETLTAPDPEIRFVKGDELGILRVVEDGFGRMPPSWMPSNSETEQHHDDTPSISAQGGDHGDLWRGQVNLGEGDTLSIVITHEGIILDHLHSQTGEASSTVAMTFDEWLDFVDEY